MNFHETGDILYSTVCVEYQKNTTQLKRHVPKRNVGVRNWPISIHFARNSAKVTSKGYWRYPVNITVILSTGHGQSQVTKDHERSPESKILFRACGTWFIVSLLQEEIKNQSHFANWPHESNDREGSGQLRVILVQIFDVFKNKNVYFWTSLVSGFKKCHFYFCVLSRNAQNRSLKNDVIKG